MAMAKKCDTVYVQYCTRSERGRLLPENEAEAMTLGDKQPAHVGSQNVPGRAYYHT